MNLREPIYEQRHDLDPMDCIKCSTSLVGTWDEEEDEVEAEPGRFRVGVILVQRCEECGQVNRR